MIRYELIGPSGVGKTTLYEYITHSPKKDRSFLTLKEAFKIAALNKSVPLSNPELWFYQQLLKTGLFRDKALGLGRNILYGLQNGREQSRIDKYDPFFVSYNILFDHLQSERYPYEAYRQIKVYTHKINEYLILEESVPPNACILFDEGMIHKHPGITEYGAKTFLQKELQNDVTLNPAGIISCEQTADVIFEQALMRKKEGILTYTQGSMSNEELREHVESSVERHRKKILLFKEYNIPVLHIDTREKKNIIMKKINKFVHTIAGKIRS